MNHKYLLKKWKSIPRQPDQLTKTGRIKKRHCKTCYQYLSISELDPKDDVCFTCKQPITQEEYKIHLIKKGYKDRGNNRFSKDNNNVYRDWYADTVDIVLLPDKVEFNIEEHGSCSADRGRYSYTEKYRGYLLK